jgi:hypothetical protein
MSKILDFLAKVAPTVASLFGGPLAGVAVEAVGSALGMPDATKEKITKLIEGGQMTGEQLAALKTAEVALQQRLAELAIDAEKIASDDRANARTMQTAVRSWIPGGLAMLTTAGFFGILIGLMTGDLQVKDNQPLLLMLGALGTSWGMIVSFYFGSSAGSQAKDAVIAGLK